MKVKVNAQSFVKCLEFAYVSAAKKDIRYYLQSIKIEYNKEESMLTFIATNGHHISKVELNVNSVEDLSGSETYFLLPEYTFKNVKSVFGGMIGAIDVEIINNSMIITDTFNNVTSFNGMPLNDGNVQKYPEMNRYFEMYEDNDLFGGGVVNVDPDYISKLTKSFSSITKEKFKSVEIKIQTDKSNPMIIKSKSEFYDDIYNPIVILMPIRK